MHQGGEFDVTKDLYYVISARLRRRCIYMYTYTAARICGFIEVDCWDYIVLSVWFVIYDAAYSSRCIVDRWGETPEFSCHSIYTKANLSRRRSFALQGIGIL